MANCVYRGCTMSDIDHDHPIHPGDTVEWRHKDGSIGGRSRVMTCFMDKGWAYFRLSHSQELFRFDRVKRINSE